MLETEITEEQIAAIVKGVVERRKYKPGSEEAKRAEESIRGLLAGIKPGQELPIGILGKKPRPEFYARRDLSGRLTTVVKPPRPTR